MDTNNDFTARAVLTPALQVGALTGKIKLSVASLPSSYASRSLAQRLVHLHEIPGQWWYSVLEAIRAASPKGNPALG